MATTKETWFIAERSEALAGLLLTSRSDVRVRDARQREDGVEFFVEINSGEALSTRVFVVQVVGTMSSDASDWMQNVEQLFSSDGNAIYLPTCVFAVNVRDNQSSYAWLAEPCVESQKATLRLTEQGDFHKLDFTAVGQIVDRVKAWYDALPRQFQHA